MKIKNLLALSVAAFLLAAVCFPQTAAARALNRNDKRRIECAMFKMRVLPRALRFCCLQQFF